jgi:hypothetical protein
MTCVSRACFVSAYILNLLQRLADHHEDSSWPFKLRLLHALCLESGYLPQALYVSGVKFDPRRDPVACGTFTDVYRGSLKGQDVAVKRVRIAGGPADREIFTKVHVSCFDSGIILTLISDLLPKLWCGGT